MSYSYGLKRSLNLGQTAGFAAGSWIVRQPPRRFSLRGEVVLSLILASVGAG